MFEFLFDCRTGSQFIYLRGDKMKTKKMLAGWVCLVSVFSFRIGRARHRT